jgi:hypothetical protein
MYRSLNVQHIVETIDRVCKRIEERFPNSGLSRVGRELLTAANDATARTRTLQKPFWPMRIAVLVISLTLVISIVAIIASLRVSTDNSNLSDVIQAIDAGVNEIILFALALLFLLSVETRWKRAKALRALHQLRSIAHVIDMHQLTKNPQIALFIIPSTPSSPKSGLSLPELARYLGYCSELLALTSKLAALHVQYLRDPVVLDAVNDVETLASGLSQKIWQKISVLELRITQGFDAHGAPADVAGQPSRSAAQP